MIEVDFLVCVLIDWNSCFDFGDINVVFCSFKMQDGKDNVYYYGMILLVMDFNIYCFCCCMMGQSFMVLNVNALSYRVGMGVGFLGDCWVWMFMYEFGHMYG